MNKYSLLTNKEPPKINVSAYDYSRRLIQLNLINQNYIRFPFIHKRCLTSNIVRQTFHIQNSFSQK